MKKIRSVSCDLCKRQNKVRWEKNILEEISRNSNKFKVNFIITRYSLLMHVTRDLNSQQQNLLDFFKIIKYVDKSRRIYANNKIKSILKKFSIYLAILKFICLVSLRSFYLKSNDGFRNEIVVSFFSRWIAILK